MNHMPLEKNIAWFSEIKKKDIPLVGGKGASYWPHTNRLHMRIIIMYNENHSQ